MSEKMNAVIIKQSVSIIVFAVITAFAVNLFHPNGFRMVAASASANDSIVELSVQEAKNRFDLGSAVFIDSRSRADFKKSHIKGAVNIPDSPLSLALEKMKKNMPLLNSPKDAVLYCSAENCGSSQNLAKIFIKKGYSRHIYIIKQGFPGWTKAGFPVEEGK